MTIVVLVGLVIGLFLLGSWLFSLMPGLPAVVGFSFGSAFRQIVSYGLCFLPARCWTTFISTVVFFFTVQTTWAIIVWIYKKMPGIN